MGSPVFVLRVLGGFVLLLLATVQSANATHLRAGEIIVERVNCQSLTFSITVTVYTNTGSSVLFGGRVGEEDILDFGDGTSILVPETQNTLRPDLGPNVGTASFTIEHTYSGPGRYVISYREPNRNEGVLNMDASVNTRFYIETEIRIDPFLGCNNTPVLLIPPIDQACTGVAFFHNPGAYDPDGDSLSYQLVVPFSDRNLQVVRYQDPATNSPREYYADFGTGNETNDGPPSFTIDPVTGTIEWNAPGLQGEYNIAFIVIEWRKVNGQWIKVGFVRRDMQILVNECDNERPDLIIPEDVCIEAGTTLNETILGIDPDNHPVKIEAFSEILNFPAGNSPATISPEPDFRPSNPPYELNFEWNTTCDHIKEQPYQVVFKITDNPGNDGPRLVTFKTWNITVVGPKPIWESATVNVNERTANLDWEDYSCQNADEIEIWRRVDSNPYDPMNCETGMLPFLGYELIAVVPANGVSSYLDNNGGTGLAPGAQYCYRLVALFPAPKSGESYMSDEICIGPILADAPVITNVTVDVTGIDDGEITVIWREPFEADPGQFPPPYQYRILRGTGFTGPPTELLNPSGFISGLTFTDTGLNTTNEVYNYAIIAYDANGGVVDTSAVASSVFLETKSDLQRIELNWSAFVPWSNSTPQYPLHLIYRGPEGSTDDELELIASVDVTANGFVYADEGQHNNTPLEDDQVYCYKVMTRGAYGNPDIDEPLENFSQMVCTQPSDTVPPCMVAMPVAIDAPDCENFTGGCGQNVYSNRIEWQRPTGGDCQNDISYYNVYVSSTLGGEYVLHATDIKTLFFEDENLPSHARCYRVSAVDRSGNESELSDEVCIDNCPYYEMPNVFTPNGDGCNDLFSAYHDRDQIGGEGEEASNCPIPIENQIKCARFVERVEFRVYNRWGQEVYQYDPGSGERNIYIDWNGRDNEGKELSTGVYYYIAEVTFITYDPAKRNQTIKGWVHLLR